LEVINDVPVEIAGVRSGPPVAIEGELDRDPVLQEIVRRLVNAYKVWKDKPPFGILRPVWSGLGLFFGDRNLQISHEF
jgi:hypothetical protein